MPAPGLVAIAGGKYTTYRLMAEQTFHESIIEEFRSNGGVVTRPYPDSTLVLVTMHGARTGRRMTLPLEYLVKKQTSDTAALYVDD